MVPVSNPHVTNNKENSARATHAKTEESARRVGTDLSVTAPALGTGPAPVREVNFDMEFYFGYTLMG